MLSELLPFVMQTHAFHQHSVKQSKGSVNPYINFSDLTWFEFPLPPLDVQQRLANALSLADLATRSLASCALRATQLQQSLIAASVVPPGDSSVTLADVATLDVDHVRVQASDTLRLAGVYSFGRGLLDRGYVQASETKYPMLQRLKAGQVVVSKLKAWEGATAVVPNAFHGAYVSPEFPTFTLNTQRLTSSFMDLVCRSPWFWSAVTAKCKGTAERRARIHPREFLELKINVPSLSYQTHVCRQVDAVQSLIDAFSRRVSAAREVFRTVLAPLDTATSTGTHDR